MTLILQSIGILLLTVLVCIAGTFCLLITAGKFFGWLDELKARPRKPRKPPRPLRSVYDPPPARPAAPEYVRRWDPIRRWGEQADKDRWAEEFDRLP